jgi:hypothetical protein
MSTDPYQPPGMSPSDDEDDSDLPPDWWLNIYWSVFWLMVAGGLLGSLIDYVKRPW